MEERAVTCLLAGAVLAVLSAGCGSELSRSPGGDTSGRTPAQAVPARAPAEVSPGRTDPELARGLELFARQCASCHGATGRGDGEAAYLLYPKPRNFVEGTFRLTSARSGLPPDADIRRTLERGMPGSAMPPWGHLPEADLRALVRTVRYLAVAGKAADLATGEPPMKPAEADALAREIFATGEPVTLGPEPQPSQALLAKGREIYGRGCAPCHGTDGAGKVPQQLRDASGIPVTARDFTKGIFKGSPSAAAIAMRIKAGIPGSPMPASNYPDDEVWALAHYVRTMVLPGAQERIEQSRRRLVVTALDREVPTHPEDPAWKNVEAVYLPVWPLWWRDRRIEGIEVSAASDGTRMALRVAWADPSPDSLANGQQLFTDGVAVQLSDQPDPPFFGMGQVGAPVTLWHWKAAWERDAAEGFGGAASGRPGMPTGEDGYPGHPAPAAFLTALSAGNPLSERRRVTAAETSSAEGFGTLTTRHAFAQNVRARGVRTQDGWATVFVRLLRGAGSPDVEFRAGGETAIGFAVWDGAGRDRDGQKSVTIWHQLVSAGSEGGAQ